MSRLSCPSMDLELKSLLREMERTLCIAFGLAIALHSLLSQVDGLREKEAATKPLTTQFIKRQPRLTKPLEMRKRPEPKRRRTKRRMVSVKPQASPHRESTSVRPPQLLPIVARPDVAVSRMHYTSVMEMEPQVRAGRIVGSREAKDVVDMSLEMLDIDALDTGRYQAMIVQYPDDKRAVRGYFHFWMPWGRNYSDDDGIRYYDGAFKAWYRLHWTDIIRFGIRRVVLRLNEWTDIKADIKGTIGFDSKRLLDTPWVVLDHWFKMYPTNMELENICRYLETGGFIYTEGNPERKDDDAPAVIGRALEYGGYRELRDWSWEELPHSHALFHCFFDFPNGPPVSARHVDYVGAAGKIEGIEIGGRIAAITSSNNNYVYFAWGLFGRDAYQVDTKFVRWDPDKDPTRQLQFGVNTIVFALTQEGSITRRVMDSVSGY